jgi:tetratricopeptide (TPR) repeat protein
VARLYHEQAGMYQQLNQLALAQASYEKALAIREQQQPSNPLALGETLYHLGQVYAAQKNLAEAKRTLQRAVKILEAQLGTSNELVASARRDYEKISTTP